MTNNVGDFRVLHASHLVSSYSHCGIVLIPSATHSLEKRSTGHLLRALDALLRAHPAEDALRDREIFH